jgi:hypothetical protein
MRGNEPARHASRHHACRRHPIVREVAGLISARPQGSLINEQQAQATASAFAAPLAKELVLAWVFQATVQPGRDGMPRGGNGCTKKHVFSPTDTDKEKSMNRPSDNVSSAMWLLGGIALGALGMYLLDPEQGNRRRALARDKMVSAAVTTRKAVDAQTRDLANRAEGVVAEVGSALPH